MRDLLLLTIVLGSTPICLLNPFFGVLMWYWVAYFNPHRFTWTYAYNFPVAAVIAAPTLLGALFVRKSNRALQARESLLLFGLWIWCGITYLIARNEPSFAGHVADANYELVRFSKVLLLTFVMVLLVTSRQRLRLLLLVTSGSLGLLAVKATIFGLRTSGESRVFGPPDSYLADNNSFALALNMALPFFFFLARQEENRWIRAALRLFLVCGIIAVLLSYSRGGQLGLAVVLTAITFKAHRKMLGGLLLAATAFLVLTFAPQGWTARMETLAKWDADMSAQQRVIAWTTAWNFAQDHPVTGGGFHTLPDVDIFQRYQPSALPGGFPSTGPHSIYLQFLADHGFVGLGLFLALLGSCMLSLRKLRWIGSFQPAGRWVKNYADMVEVSLLGYMVSGAFLGHGYFDFAYQVIATTSVLKVLLAQELRPAWIRDEEFTADRLQHKESVV